MSALEKIKTGLKAVVPFVANTVIPGSGTMLETLMRGVTGDKDSDIEAVAAKIEADPALYVQLQISALQQEVNLAQINSNNLATVNETMRAESKSEKWPQYSWRPFNGFCFPIAVLTIYFVLPLCKVAVPNVPDWVWLGWLSILGVATYGRNKEKQAKAGATTDGFLASAIKAIKG